MSILSAVKERVNQLKGEDIVLEARAQAKYLREKAYHALETARDNKEVLKSFGISTAMVAGGVNTAIAVGATIAQVGVFAATGATAVLFGFETLATKIADKYFRKQIFNNTMDESSERAFKIVCLVIKSLLEEGRSEAEILKYLGSLDGAQTATFAAAFNKAVKEAEAAGAYNHL